MHPKLGQKVLDGLGNTDFFGVLRLRWSQNARPTSLRMTRMQEVRLWGDGGDDAAGDAGTGIAGGIGLLIVWAGVHDDGGASGEDVVGLAGAD